MGIYLTREDLKDASKKRKPLTEEEKAGLSEAIGKQLRFTIADVEKGEQNRHDDVCK